MAGNAAGLPVVIFIEAANPAVTIHGDIEVGFVAGRTELRSIRAHFEGIAAPYVEQAPILPMFEAAAA